MATKKSYNRYFIIFQEEDKGFGIAMDKQPTGYTKIETKNGRCKITVYVQNLVKEKGPYTCCLIDATKNPGLVAKLGEIKIDDSGRGETWWEYKEDDILSTGMPVDRFNVATVIAEANDFKSPLTGYAGKDKVSWRDKVQFGTNEMDKINGDTYRSDKEKKEAANEAPANPVAEEAKKFDEYENKIKAEAEKVNNPQVQPISNEIANPQEQPIQEEAKEEKKPEPVKESETNKPEIKPAQTENKAENKPEAKPVQAENKEENKPEIKPIQVENKSEPVKEAEIKKPEVMPAKAENKEDVKPEMIEKPSLKPEKDEEKDEVKVVVDEDNMLDMASKDCSKKTKNSDLFHKILKGCEEVHHLVDEIKDCRWWKVFYDDDIMLKDNDLYPYYCVVNHLKMTYPYLNYVQYFKKRGYYYFGIKYDDKGEVKYLMYGIEGYEDPMHQPYKGTTGFSKWIKLRNHDHGIWVMYYNPYNGYVLIPKSKNK